MALGTATSPFWNPNATYGADRAWRQTPFVQQHLDPQIPEGVYNAFLGERGFGGTDAMSTWAQGLYGKTLSGYKSALRARPDLTYRDYLGKQFTTDSLRNQFAAATPRQRGESTYGVGNPRIIGWG